jgi:hypothetical protein
MLESLTKNPVDSYGAPGETAKQFRDKRRPADARATGATTTACDEPREDRNIFPNSNWPKARVAMRRRTND